MAYEVVADQVEVQADHITECDNGRPGRARRMGLRQQVNPSYALNVSEVPRPPSEPKYIKRLEHAIQVQRVSRDQRYTVRQKLLMLALLAAAAAAALVTANVIPLPHPLAIQGPLVLSVLIALLTAALTAPQVSRSRDPVKRHLELTLNWDCGYEPYFRHPGTSVLLALVRQANSRSGLTVCKTSEPARSRGVLLRASALDGAIPLLIPATEIESEPNIDRIWATRLSKRRHNFPVPRPYRLFVVIDCADQSIGKRQIEFIDQWQRTWPASSVVILEQPSNFRTPSDLHSPIQRVDLGDPPCSNTPAKDRARQLSETLEVNDAPESRDDPLMFLDVLDGQRSDLLVAPLQCQGKRVSWLAGLRPALWVTRITAPLAAGIAVHLALHLSVPIGEVVLLALAGLFLGLLVPTMLLVAISGISISFIGIAWSSPSRRWRIGLCMAAAIVGFFFGMDSGVDWPDCLGLGFSFGLLAYAHLARVASGVSIPRFATAHKQELVCALTLMLTWQIASYQTDFSDTAAWTLVVGVIGFWMRASARRSRKWEFNVCAAGLLIITVVSGLLGTVSLLATLGVNVPTISPSGSIFVPSDSAANLVVACQQLCIAASFLFFAAIIALKHCGCKSGDLVTLFRWMAVTVSIAIAEPLVAAVQGFPGMLGGLQVGRYLLARFDPVGTDMWALALTGGIVLMLLLSLTPRGISPIAREAVCVAALVVAATAAYEPSVIVSQNSLLSDLIVGPFTGANDLLSAPYLGLVLMTTLWLASMHVGRRRLLPVLNFALDVSIYLVCSFPIAIALIWYIVVRHRVIFELRPPFSRIVLAAIEPFGSAAFTIMVAFVLFVLLRLSGRHIGLLRRIATVQGVRCLRSRFTMSSGSLARLASSATAVFDFLSFGQLRRMPLRWLGLVCLGAFFVSLQRPIPSGMLSANGIPVPMQFISGQRLLAGFVSLLSALILWRIVQLSYQGYVNYLAATVGALGLFIFNDTGMILLALLMVIFGGPLESSRRMFQRPSKRSLGFALGLGVASLVFFWAFAGVDVEAAAVFAVIPAVIAAVIHPVNAERLPASVLRRNQLRLRQMIYWLTALASPVLLLALVLSSVGQSLNSSGWQGGGVSNLVFLLSVLLFGAASCSWIASGWWAASAFAAGDLLRWRPRPEEAYGRYYGTVREISGCGQRDDVSAGVPAEGEDLIPAGQDQPLQDI